MGLEHDPIPAYDLAFLFQEDDEEEGLWTGAVFLLGRHPFDGVPHRMRLEGAFELIFRAICHDPRRQEPRHNQRPHAPRG